ncbi:uncharacterized protein LOC141639010 [Silene latifolia]|uniref:uncharacterized protein LOC141639010 n=1 Tax=Silene latifolia TaxID=37657 RepID=UPI003D776A26
MGRPFLILLCLCFLAVRGSHASVSPEDYWKYKLPTTPMPHSIKDSLLPSGGVNANSIANTELYDGLAYAQDSAKELTATTDAYGGLLSYGKDSTKHLTATTKGYDGLLSYTKYSAKDSLDSANGYKGLLSYAKSSAQDSLAGTNGPYKGLLSYVKDTTKSSLASTNGYNGLLSYAKDSPRDSLASTNGYDGLLSYAKDSAKDSLIGTNGYNGLLSYANGYDGLLSYAKGSAKDSLIGSNGYNGLLSYAKDSAKDSIASTNGYDGLLSYAKPSRKLLQYDGLLSYAPKASPKANTQESQTSSTGIMEDAVFFVESDLHHGKKMNLVFKKGTQKSFFLPREVANKIPFSSSKLSEIYDILSMDPESQEAYVLSQRIELCEEPKVEGVEKKCVTSLESMVDFVTSKIGNNVQSLTTSLEKDHPKMEYTLKTVKKLSKNDHETVVCHKMGYPYAVFFCHGTATIRSYMVSLVGSDGTKIEAVAACHKETNDFLTNYMVNVLKVVPGSTRVCHLPGAEDNIVWVAK